MTNEKRTQRQLLLALGYLPKGARSCPPGGRDEPVLIDYKTSIRTKLAGSKGFRLARRSYGYFSSRTAGMALGVLHVVHPREVQEANLRGAGKGVRLSCA